MSTAAPATRWDDSALGRFRPGLAAPPGDLLAGLNSATKELSRLTRLLGTEVQLAADELLTRRERLSSTNHLPRTGQTLRGGGFIAECADGWLACNLPREVDWELIPALTEGKVFSSSAQGLCHWLSNQTSAEVLERSAMLGLAISTIPSAHLSGSRPVRSWPHYLTASQPMAHKDLAELNVLDLGRLWAGPLAASLLAQAGAQVTRLTDHHSAETPLPSDGDFYAQLHHGKQLQQIDFQDRQKLQSLVTAADVVIFSSRRRAIESLGLTRRPDQIWLCISAYGPSTGLPQRIGFGDDAAAAAGLVSWNDAVPDFVGDAIADPITGLLGALAVLQLLDRSSSALIDISLHDCAHWAMWTTENGVRCR